jgi:polysaccharide biosynthesis/export protein
MRHKEHAIRGLERSALRRMSSCGLLVLIVAVACSVTLAQGEPPASTAPPNVASSAAVTTGAIVSVPRADERYRIGPGDVLDIRIFNRPQLSREARVDANGLIQMPLIEGDIRAACRTESELAKDIATLYLKYQRNPYVNVFVKEYSSTPVAVIGAVDKPGQFQLKRRVRLLELLAFAGGPTEKAGGKIQVAHTGAISLCEGPTDMADSAFDFYTLKDAMRGQRESNPYIQAGDIVSIPEADQAFVVGNVFKPQAVLLKEPVTVSEAIAMAGGHLRATRMNGIQIIRQVSGSTQKLVIPVDLSAIQKQRAQDILLEPNDVVQVPTNEGKIFMDKVLSAFTGGLSSIPYIIR